MRTRSFFSARSHGWRILVGFASLALALPAQATFHFMQIEQVIGGVNGDTTAQAVQLRMRFAGQTKVGGSQLVAYDAAGNNPITLLTFPDNVSTGVYKSGLSFVEELQVLNHLYTEQLIGDREYIAAFKKKYREFWPIRDQLDPTLRDTVRALFDSQASRKTPLLAIKAGAVWKGVHPGKRR